MTQQTVKLAALAHSKLRNAIGLVGIEVFPIEQEIKVKLAKNWPRSELNKIAPDIARIYEKSGEWSNTIIDQMVGEHVIQGIRRASGVPIKIIYIKNKELDPSEIRRVRKMDMVEMTQYLLQLKQVHKIKFPNNPSSAMQELESQVALFAEHSTEVGMIKYYAPGDELDNLTKALLIASFAARPFIQDSVKIVGGSMPKGNLRSETKIEDMMSKLTSDVTYPRSRKRL